MIRAVQRLFPTLALLLSATAAPAAGPALAATDWDGKPAEVRPGGGITVVAFLSLDCPVSNSYLAPLTAMAKEYAGKGVTFVGLLPGEAPSAALRKRFDEFQVGFPVRLDPKLAAADALGAETVPEVFVLDSAGAVRYRGRVDDAYNARLKRNLSVESHDLKDALDALLAGKPVAKAVTKAVGCPIFREKKEPAPAASAVTYHGHVAPILAQHCQGCHRPGQVGPFSLTNYKQAKTWADDIREYTQSRAMPPWKPVGGPGYRNERTLTPAEIDTLAKWAEAGAPEGNANTAAALPPAPADPDGWELGPPDLIITPSESFRVGASGNDVFRCFVVPTGLTDDKYVVGYEVKPGNPRVVHHVINFWDRTGKARQMEADAKARALPNAEDRGPGYNAAMGIGFTTGPAPARPDVGAIGSFGGWAPGIRATSLPPGAGMLLPKGSDFVIQTHYHRTGKPEEDKIRVGLYFAKGPVEKPWRSLSVAGMARIPGLPKQLFPSIPAGDDHHVKKGSAWTTAPGLLHSVMPHMHLLGKSIKVTMTTPDGVTTTLVDIPKWDYNWQEAYWFKEPVAAPEGTRIDVEGVFDNSSANPLNPFSPPQRVYAGEETTSEMLFGFIGATPTTAARLRALPTPPEKPKPAAKPGA